jgi:O-antigen ligase
MVTQRHTFFLQRLPGVTRLLEKASHVDIFDFIIVMSMCFFFPIPFFLFFHFQDMALLVFAFILIPFGAKEFKRVYFAKEHLLILLFALCGCIALLINPGNEAGSFIYWSMYLMPCILVLSLSQIIFYKRDDAVLEKVLILVGLFLAGQLFFSLLFLPHSTSDLHENANIYWTRSNYIAAMLEPSIILCYHRMHRNDSEKAIAIFTFIVCLVALLFTVSRGGIITVIASLLLYSLLRKKFVSSLIVGIVTALFLPRYSSRFTTLLDSGNVDRIYLWLQSIEMFLKKPILGYGPGNIPLYATLFSKTDIMTDPHNFILTLLLHTGCVGFILFFLLMVMFIRRAVVVYKKRQNPFFLVVIFAALTHGMVEPTFIGFSYSFLFWYCMVMLLIQSERLRNNYESPGRTKEMDRLYS